MWRILQHCISPYYNFCFNHTGAGVKIHLHSLLKYLCIILKHFQKFIKKVLTKQKTFVIMSNVLVKRYKLRDLSSAGRASALQAEGHRFESYRSHSWRDSSVGQSTRFIPVVSRVQIPLSLLNFRKRKPYKIKVSFFLRCMGKKSSTPL